MSQKNFRNCRFPQGQPSGKSRFGQSRVVQSHVIRNQRGQIVVEYILLLAVAVAMAMLITKTLVGRDPGSPGFVISAWSELLTQMGSDTADDVKAAK